VSVYSLMTLRIRVSQSNPTAVQPCNHSIHDSDSTL